MKDAARDAFKGRKLIPVNDLNPFNNELAEEVVRRMPRAHRKICAHDERRTEMVKDALKELVIDHVLMISMGHIGPGPMFDERPAYSMVESRSPRHETDGEVDRVSGRTERRNGHRVPRRSLQASFAR